MGGTSLVNVEGNRGNHMYVIATLGEPSRIYSRPSANINDLQWRRREISIDYFFRSRKFQRPRGKAAEKAVRFVAPAVVRKYVWIQFWHIDQLWANRTLDRIIHLTH